MNDTHTLPDELEEHLTPAAPSRDPNYLTWRDEQVTSALADAREHPESMIPEHKLWKKFGLEY